MKFFSPRLQAYFYLLINTITWGGAFIIIKPALESTTPYRFLFTRFVLASILTLPFVYHYFKKKKLTWNSIRTIGGLELLGTTATLTLVYFGLERTSAIEASLISTTVPLFVILLGITFLRERQERHEWVGFILSFIGMILISFLPALTNGQVSHRISLSGNMLILCANLLEASYFILIKRAYKKIPKLLVAAVSFWVGALSFGILSLWQTHWSVSTLSHLISQELMVPSVAFAVGYMVVFGSIIGLTSYIKGQDLIEASEASLFRYLQPAVYLPLGVLVLGESIKSWHIVGLALIITGVLVAERTVTKTVRHRKPRA